MSFDLLPQLISWYVKVQLLLVVRRCGGGGGGVGDRRGGDEAGVGVRHGGIGDRCRGDGAGVGVGDRRGDEVVSPPATL